MSPFWEDLDSGTGTMNTKKCCTEPAQVCKLPPGHFFPLVLLYNKCGDQSQVFAFRLNLKLPSL